MTRTPAAIDLLDLDRWARDGAPHHWFARLRETAPVWRHPSPTGDGRPGFWVVSGYDDVAALGRCPHALSSDDDHGGVSGLGPGDELETETRRAGAELGPGRAALGNDAKFLLTLDPPEHTAYRAIVSRGFTPRMVSRLEPRVRDPGLIPGAVEEILRWASPVLYFRRNALTAMDVRGQHIEPGDIVSLWYVSANRDEARFPSPGTFDIGRRPNPHLAFGGGPHFCLGASLARLELRVLLEELLDRYRQVEVTGPVQRLRSNFLHGIKHLPVRAHPAGR